MKAIFIRAAHRRIRRAIFSRSLRLLSLFIPVVDFTGNLNSNLIGILLIGIRDFSYIIFFVGRLKSDESPVVGKVCGNVKMN